MENRPIIAPGEIRVLAEGWEETWERSGLSARKSLICRWEDQGFLPHIGDPFGTDVFGVLCLCTRITVTGYGKTGSSATNPSYEYAYAECEYASDMLTGTTTEISVTVGGDVLAQSIGRNYVTGVIPCEDQIPFMTATLAYSVTKIVAAIPTNLMMNYAAKVNSDVIWGFSIGCVRFDGFSATSEYDPTGSVRYRVTYNFSIRANSWNEVWRPPVYLRDPPGSNEIATYQNTTGGLPTSTADANLVGTKIIQKAGGLDTLDPPVYESAIFAGVF